MYDEKLDTLNLELLRLGLQSLELLTIDLMPLHGSLSKMTLCIYQASHELFLVPKLHIILVLSFRED